MLLTHDRFLTVRLSDDISPRAGALRASMTMSGIVLCQTEKEHDAANESQGLDW